MNQKTELGAALQQPLTPEYRIYLDDELLCKTDWLPRAVAAWDRASRDRNSAQHGGLAVILKNNQMLASVQPQTLHGHPWPDAAAPEPALRDLAAAIQQLAFCAGVKASDIAQQMTAAGLPTTRSRLDSIKTLQQGKRANVSAAELIVFCYGAIAAIKENEGKT